MAYKKVDCFVCNGKGTILVIRNQDFESVTMTVKKCTSCGEQLQPNEVSWS